MKKAFFLSIFFLICFLAKANNTSDSLEIVKLKLQHELIENQVKELRRDQLNYSIEKDIYKEVYKNNFDRLNLTITFVLGLFGVMGFLGIRNINSIKKDYSGELQELKNLRKGFEDKIAEFTTLKEKYDSEIEEISKTNQRQSNKILVLELKEKIKKLMGENDFSLALETVALALENSPNEISLLMYKSIIECRLGFYKNAIKTLSLALQQDPENESFISNLVEIYYFNNQIDKAKELIERHKKWFDEKKDGKLIKYFDTIDIYHNKDTDVLKKIIEEQIDRSNLSNKNKLFSWDFDDIHWFHANVKYPAKEILLINYIWYIRGEISGEKLLELLNNAS